jgi:phosphopantothenoylcysteine decarboxylase / phosphopantothenate---cysteine ligase
MGYAIAEELALHGAEVMLVSGPVSVSTSKKADTGYSRGICRRDVPGMSASHFTHCDGAVLSAAVADYTPAHPEASKKKKRKANLQIELKPTKDIAASLGQIKRQGQILV